jgi:hypothetical protein
MSVVLAAGIPIVTSRSDPSPGRFRLMKTPDPATLSPRERANYQLEEGLGLILAIKAMPF